MKGVNLKKEEEKSSLGSVSVKFYNKMLLGVWMCAHVNEFYEQIENEMTETKLSLGIKGKEYI